MNEIIFKASKTDLIPYSPHKGEIYIDRIVI